MPEDLERRVEGLFAGKVSVHIIDFEKIYFFENLFRITPAYALSSRRLTTPFQKGQRIDSEYMGSKFLMLSIVQKRKKAETRKP